MQLKGFPFSPNIRAINSRTSFWLFFVLFTEFDYFIPLIGSIAAIHNNQHRDMATKRRREVTKAPTEEEWSRKKGMMYELYVEMRMPLHKVMTQMESDHDFIAS